jgi:hypothetical protein
LTFVARFVNRSVVTYAMACNRREA